VWKVKKAFKIQVFWKGGKPTFLVGIHKDPFNLISILLCETCSMDIDRQKYMVLRDQGTDTELCLCCVHVWVCERERAAYQTAAESKQRPACGSRSVVSPERWSHKRWSVGAMWRYC